METPRGFQEGPFSYHQEIELTIDDLANLGQGVGRIEGWVVMVPGSLPQERVRARVFKNHAGHSEADLIEVLEPSPYRLEAPCPLFGECGGCQYQHLGYERQLEWKQRQVAEVLQRLCGLEIAVDSVIPSPLAYGYRTKITPHFEKPRQGAIGEIGFLRRGRGRKILDVPHCPIASDAINAALPAARAEIRAKASTFKRGATLMLRDCGGKVLQDNRDIASEKVGDLTFRFLAGDFFQNNAVILPAFTGHVAEMASEGGTRFLVDAYCGSGLFGLSAAKDFERVAGIEVAETSLDWAKHNAEANGIKNAEFVAGSAEAIFDQIDFPAEETAVIIDPPRKGSTPGFLDQLIQFGPKRVVYVSCNPATQARDLIPLLEGGYQAKRVQPFDLFPQTRHLECVVTLEKG